VARVLIAGCGDVGTLLGVQLLGAGHRVWGLRRQVAKLPSTLAPVAGDLNEPRTLAKLPDALDYVVYLVAADAYSESAYQDAYVGGLRNLLAALSRTAQPVRRVLFASSTGVYGQQDGSWVDESSVTEPVGFSGRTMLEAEETVSRGPYPSTVVRFAGIYGPGRHRLIDRVRQGGPCQADPPLYTNRIHREDCANVLAHILALAKADPLYLGVDQAPVPECEVMDWLARQLGVSAPARRGDGRANVSRERPNKRCSNQRLAASGYVFRYPSFVEGYSALLQERGDP
jgi:nucleoside-diphosphate-sugar epimerase